MMKTTKVLEPFQRQNASNSSANQNKKQKPKQKLKPKSQKTTALNPNPTKLISSSHSNSCPFYCRKVSFQYIISFKNFRWFIYLV